MHFNLKEESFPVGQPLSFNFIKWAWEFKFGNVVHVLLNNDAFLDDIFYDNDLTGTPYYSYQSWPFSWLFHKPVNATSYNALI